jgi:catechol 2,3-dioxygenase
MEVSTLPVQTRVLAVALRVSNLEQSLAFYKNLVGFSEIHREDGDAWLSASGDPPSLIHLSEMPGARPRPQRSTGLYHVAVRLPSEKALGRLLNRLMDQEWPLQGAADHGVSQAVYTADPDDNGLEFYADRPRETWRVAGGVIQMVTDPLKMSAGLDSGLHDDNPWEGIHPATDIGHVHLQVSDLARARAFYHDALGLDVTQESYPGALFLSAGGYHHHLGLNTWAGAGAPPPPPDAVGMISFTLGIPDLGALDAAAARLKASGAHVEAEEGGWLARDPDGVILELALLPEVTMTT